MMRPMVTAALAFVLVLTTSVFFMLNRANHTRYEPVAQPTVVLGEDGNLQGIDPISNQVRWTRGPRLGPDWPAYKIATRSVFNPSLFVAVSPRVIHTYTRDGSILDAIPVPARIGIGTPCTVETTEHGHYLLGLAYPDRRLLYKRHQTDDDWMLIGPLDDEVRCVDSAA